MKLTHIQQHETHSNSLFRGSVLSLPEKMGSGIAGGAMMGVFSLGGVSVVEITGVGVFSTS